MSSAQILKFQPPSEDQLLGLRLRERILVTEQALRALTHRALRFAHFPRALSAAFGMEFAVISIVQAERQLFPVRHGLELLETDLNHCYCKFPVMEGKTLVVEDALGSALVCENLATLEFGVRSYVGSPIKIFGHTVGALACFSTAARSFDHSDVTMIEYFAELVESELRKEIETELSALCPRPGQEHGDSLFRTTLDTINQAFICLSSDARVEFVNRAGFDAFGQIEIGSSFEGWAEKFDVYDDQLRSIELENLPFSRALRGELIRDVQVHVVDRSRPDDMPRWYSISASPTRSQRLRAVDASPTRFSVVGILFDITEQKRGELALRRSLITDSLTGLMNRRGFFQAGEKVLLTAREESTELLLIFADLDGLKAINDQYGHAMGDECINTAASLLRDTLGEHAIIARLGGDEFTALLASAEPEHTVARLTAARDALQTSSQSKVSVALSIGHLVLLPDQHRTLDEALSEADSLMYERKESRRALRFQRR